jgi:glycosyltransferase involved in cell wall biosynthesis
MGPEMLWMNLFQKISVVMPLYNGASYLGESIESIPNQVFTDFGFFIIDNGSTNGTWRNPYQIC